MSFMSQGLTEVPTQSWYPKQGRPIRQPVDTEINAGNGDDLDESTDVVEDETIVATHSESGDHGSNRQGIEEADLMDVEHDEDDVMDEDDKIRDHIYWGWEVSKFMTDNDIYGEQSRHIARSKLLLDHSSHTKHIRNQLASTVKDLRARKLIRDETDIIADFLSRLFRHTKSEMNRQHGYRNDCSVEFVLCIPVMWTEKACRIMQNAMTRALREAEFIEHSNYDVDNLFIVTEPEAASTYALERSREITAGDCFLLLDAGGGTVDAITYRVASRSPLRLEREEFDPEASHTELEEIEKGIAIEGKINELLLKFETQIKRGVDIYSSDLEPERLFVGGLTAKDNEKYIKPNRLIISKNDFRNIFKPCLDGVSELMFSQLRKAEKAGVEIGKVILIGGFSSSPSLHHHIKRQLEQYSQQIHRQIHLTSAPMPGTAVAHGAILRAANKVDGPERRIRSSYGIYCTERYEPTVWEAHAKVNPWYDPVDGKRYIKKSIDWIIDKGELLPSGKIITRQVLHTFPAEPGIEFICEEVLCVSSKHHESHYREKHAQNKGYEIAGRILVDMTFLKDDPNFHPVEPGPGGKGQLHYCVEFELVIKVYDRNLRFEARYPAGEDGAVMGARQISIAASFQPGTA